MIGFRWFVGTLLFLAGVTCWAAPAQILMIRHAEKPDSADSSSSSDDLSPQGYQRARAYVKYFENDPAVTRYGTPVAIYAMGAGSEDSSLRPVETVTPLAKSLGLTVQDSYEKDDIKPLVDEILSTPAYDGKMVLICWEHKKLDNIAAQFGVSPKPDTYPGDAFDWVWEIDFSGSSVSNFRKFQAKILPSD